MKKIFRIVRVALMSASSSGGKINDKEVPSYTVRIDLGSYALWTTYGVSGVGDYRVFDRSRLVPANFPFTANTYTGYGGVLLIMAFDALSGNYSPQAYDLACPVENSQKIKITIDEDKLEAVCPQCKSRYNVLNGGGGPLSGQALTSKYGLRKYHVYTSQMGGYTVAN